MAIVVRINTSRVVEPRILASALRELSRRLEQWTEQREFMVWEDRIEGEQAISILEHGMMLVELEQLKERADALQENQR